MTTEDFLSAERAALIAGTKKAADLAERYRKLGDLERLIGRDIKLAKAEIANELHKDRSWEQVGELLGVTGSRAEQISRASR